MVGRRVCQTFMWLYYLQVCIGIVWEFLIKNIDILNQFIKNYYFPALFSISYVLLRPCEFKFLQIRFISLGLFSLSSFLNEVYPFEVSVLGTKDADYQCFND